MKRFSTHRGFAIEWVDYMECYRIYDLKKPTWTVVYSDDTVEEIKRKIDKQIFKEE